MKSLAETYADLLNSNFGSAGIRASVIDDHTIVLTGKYSNLVTPVAVVVANGGAAQPGYNATNTIDLGAIAKRDPLERFLGSMTSELKVVNLIAFQTKSTRQVLVHAKVIDINRSALKNLGVNWGTVAYTNGSNGNIISTFQNQPILFGQVPNLSDTLGKNTNGFFTNDLLGGGPLSRVFPFAAQLNALITDNKARVLSEPSLVVLDGSEGSMLVGGEIPIPVAQSNAGGVASISVDYKQFGIKLDVSPTILNDNTVQLTVTPEVSALDFADAVQFSGFVIPALTVRRATSTLQMADGQTLVIGGLYDNSVSKQVQKIPVLGDVPVLGEFFRNTVTTKTETELLILIEPEIVTSTTPGVVPPAPNTLENMPITKPDVKRREFDQDFPNIQATPADRNEKPEPPAVNLPASPVPGK